jgi:hypothetical protein
MWPLAPRQKWIICADARALAGKVRARPGERANAQLKTWSILRKLRCCRWRAGQLAKAICVHQAREMQE